MMKKNILAENMLRFGVKNLSESDVTRLTEDTTVNNVPEDMKLTVQAMNAAFKAKKAVFMGNSDTPDVYKSLPDAPFSFKEISNGGKSPQGNLGSGYKIYFNDGKVAHDLNTDLSFGRPEANYNQLKDLDVTRYQNAFVNGIGIIKNAVLKNYIKSLSRMQQQHKMLLLGALGDAAKNLLSSNVIANRWKAASDAVGKQQP